MYVKDVATDHISRVAHDVCICLSRGYDILSMYLCVYVHKRECGALAGACIYRFKIRLSGYSELWRHEICYCAI